jgi:hypothetical protein
MSWKINPITLELEYTKPPLEYNALTFGAVGDGVADDTVALQAAIDAAHQTNRAIVFLPAGTYKISSALTMYSNIALRGAGMELVTIKQTTLNAHGLVGSGLSSVILEDFTLQGNGSGSTAGTGTGCGINFDYGGAGNNPFHNFRNLQVRNWGSDGIKIQTAIVSSFEKVYVAFNGGNGFNWYEGGTSCNFQACWARQNAQSGWRFNQSVYQSLNGCAADNNGISYEIIDAQSIGFFGCGSEGALKNNATYNGFGWKISNSSEITLSSCWVTDNRNLGVWVTNGAGGIILNVADNTPNATAVNFIKVDSGCNVSIKELRNSTANSLADGTTNIYNDGAGGDTIKKLTVSDSSGDLLITAATDGGDFNIYHGEGTAKTLAFYGSGAGTLNVELLDGNLTVTTGDVTVTAGDLIVLAGNVGINKAVPTVDLHVVGNFQVDDADTATKGYRFRTTGTNLDIDAAAKNLYISTYTGAGFTGTQRQYIEFGAEFEFEKHYKKTIWDNAGDMLVIDKDAATYKMNLVGSMQMDGLRIDQAPTAETPTPTHTFTISLNGVNYKIPCVAA